MRCFQIEKILRLMLHKATLSMSQRMSMTVDSGSSDTPYFFSYYLYQYYCRFKVLWVPNSWFPHLPIQGLSISSDDEFKKC